MGHRSASSDHASTVPVSAPSPTPLEELQASLAAEVARWSNRHPHFDVAELFAMAEDRLFGPVKAARSKLGTEDDAGVVHPDATLAPKLDVLVQALEANLADARRLHDELASVPPSNVKYTKAAYDLAKVAFPIFKKIRDRLAKRLPPTETAQLIKKHGGVGANVRDNGPSVVAKYGRGLLNELTSAANQPTFADAGIDAALLAKRLQRVVPPLEAELKKSVSDSFKGEVSPAVEKALVLFDLTAERTIAFLEDHGAADEAQVFHDRIPRGYARRATDPQQPADEEDGKDETDGADEKAETDEKAAGEESKEQTPAAPAGSKDSETE